MERKTVFLCLFLYLMFVSCAHIDVAAKNVHSSTTAQDYENYENRKITTHMRRGGGGGHGGGGSHGGSGSRGGSSSRGGGSRGGRDSGTGSSSSSFVPRGGIYPYPYYGSTGSYGNHNRSGSCGSINHHKGGAFTVVVALTVLTLIITQNVV